ncbi:hypothetical protein EDB80DRAFT_826759 [Ilyonectria destructans]|nr:hypothetical protein EDB80DRAFT_826759 [Ilyonectria destructans]
MHIQRLFIYPIKSILPVEVTFAEVTSEGFRFDRQYILIKALPTERSSRFSQHLTIKTLPALSLFQPSIDSDWSQLTIRYTLAQPASSITIPLTPAPLSCRDSKTFELNIWGTCAVGIDIGDTPAEFFSGHLAMPVRLLFIGGEGRREIPGAAFIQNRLGPLVAQSDDRPRSQGLRFADAAPFLVTSVASEVEARSRLPMCDQAEDIILRFRPNIHIDGGPDMQPFEEDFWKQLTVCSGSHEAKKAIIRCIFKTPRCLSLNVDLVTGKTAPRARQLYGLLAQDRRVNSAFPHKPVFGQYACVAPIGTVLRVGDRIQVTDRTGGSN